MKNLKNQFLTLLLIILIVSILFSSCSTCQSSKYRRKYFSELQKNDLNNNICKL